MRFSKAAVTARALPMHAQAFGRPYGAIALLDPLALVRRTQHCRLTDHAELAALAM